MTFGSLLNKVYNRIKWEARRFRPGFHKSFSQCGEDMIARFYLDQPKGFYVDIGAYHPKRISNTCYFHLKGWTGINIDGSKKSIELFNKMRPNNINLHCCVGSTASTSVVDFYMFDSAELNTFDQAALPEILKYHGQKPVAIEKIQLRSLQNILDEHMPADKQIDLLSIDAEGADEEILLSNDWDCYRPTVIIVEKHCTVYDFLTTNMHQFLIGKGYVLGGYSRHSYIFHEVNYNF